MAVHQERLRKIAEKIIDDNWIVFQRLSEI